MTTIENFKQLFLNLTEWTVPFGYEETLEPILPQGFKKDSFGNYYYEIGNSETLFTTHLDTFSSKREKVNHIIEENIVGTDGKTILGGDNKLGTSILINMVQERKPGVYYFFLGEEPIGKGGLKGSRSALKSNPEYFKKFKRCIAFDRKEYGSIVTRQMGRNCCSMEFATSVAENLKKFGIDWDKSVGYGYYTDTAVFMDTIPEVTNLSAGGFREHHNDEVVDLEYTYDVLKAALNIDWESLPVVRELEKTDPKPQPRIKKFIQVVMDKITKDLFKITDTLDLTLTKSRKTDKGYEMVFSRWLEDFDLSIIVDYNGNIIINNQIFKKPVFGNVSPQFKEFILTQFKDYLKELIEYYKEQGDRESITEIQKVFGFKNQKEFFKKLI
jgi:hypothetical protein